MSSSSYYSAFIASMQSSAAALLAENGNVMFNVKLSKHALWDAYLAAIVDPERRQHYNCATCRSFVNRYGRLAVITSSGKVKSLLWGDWATGELRDAILAMQALVEAAPISSIYYASAGQLGIASTTCDRHGYNDHMHLVVPEAARYKGTQRDWELANWAQRDFSNFMKASEEFTQQQIDTAFAIVSGDGINRSELVLPQATWVQETMQIIREKKNTDGFANKLWKRIGNAPIGWASWKNSLFGTAVKDIKGGKSVAAVKGRLNDKTSSVNYMHTKREITQTDKDLALSKLRELGLIESLQRRYGVKADYVDNAVWLDCTPVRANKPAGDDPFAHIPVVENRRQPAVETVDDSQISTMTWARFKRDVLKNAKGIEVQVPVNTQHFMSLVGPVNKDAPNILKWDNSIGWFYESGADAVFDQRLKRENAAYGAGLEVSNTLIWSGYSDLDLALHFAGTKVYFGQKKWGNYELDVDMNAHGRKSAEPVENIISKFAMRGQKHIVRVTLFDYRSESPSKPIEFTVRVCVMGQTKFFTGKFPAFTDGSNFDVVAYEITNDGQVIWTYGEGVREGSNGSYGPTTWGLVPGSFVKCEGIVSSPNAWGNEDQANTHTMFMLEGCRHDPQSGNGYAFLNEFLRSDLHPHRATMEKYCKSLPLAGAEEANAAGLGYSPNFDWNVLLRVKQKIGTVESTRLIKIDRME